jgi:hypothetical protein
VKEREKKSPTKRNREKMKRAGWLMAVTRTCQVHARMRPRTKDDRRINVTHACFDPLPSEQLRQRQEDLEKLLHGTWEMFGSTGASSPSTPSVSKQLPQTIYDSAAFRCHDVLSGAPYHFGLRILEMSSQFVVASSWFASTPHHILVT